MNARIRELHCALVAHGFARDATATDVIRYTGVLRSGGRSFRCAIMFDDAELARLPRVRVLETLDEEPAILAHVDADGDYCYVQRDALVLDRFNIAGSVALSVELMRASLERSQTSQAQEEIAAEFPQHWIGIPVYIDIKSTPTTAVKLYRFRRPDCTDFHILADSPRILRLMAAGQKSSGSPTAFVQTSELLTFKPGSSRPKTFGDFLSWLAGLDSHAADQALRATREMHPHKPHVFVQAPNGTVGCRLNFVPAIWKSFQRPQALAHYVDRHRMEINLTRYTAEPIDPQFLYTRNMDTQPNLSGRRIVLVGCGTIGSHLAKLLAQSGAGFGADAHLMLIDEQRLKPGNIGRHLLGTADIGKFKSTAVRDLLMSLYPELSISAHTDDVAPRLSNLDHADLVIDATGDEGVSNAINGHVIEHRKAGESVPVLIFSWLFGNGAAAQALCVSKPTDACYKCLRPQHGGQWRFSPLKPDYHMHEVAAQCGEGPFFPYGVAAPVAAAALALQLAFDWARGDPSPRLRTQLLAFDKTQRVRDQNPLPLSGCPACGTGY